MLITSQFLLLENDLCNMMTINKQTRDLIVLLCERCSSHWRLGAPNQFDNKSQLSSLKFKPLNQGYLQVTCLICCCQCCQFTKNTLGTITTAYK